MAPPEIPKQSMIIPGLSVPVSEALRSQTSKFGFFNIAQLALRIIVIGFSLSGVATMVTSTEDVDASKFGVPIHASYTSSTALRYKVLTDSVVSGLTLLSVILVIALNRPKTNPKNYFYLFLHDLVAVLLLLSGCSAATAIGFVGKYGQEKSGWIPICNMTPKFCNKITVSVASSYVAFFCLVALNVVSAHKLKTPPYLERI